MIYQLGLAPLRFAELRRRASPVSPKMLIHTVRGLARLGLVTRTVKPTMPPGVEYGLTDLGRSFLETAYVICGWVQDNLDALDEACRSFDMEVVPSNGAPSGKGIEQGVELSRNADYEPSLLCKSPHLLAVDWKRFYGHSSKLPVPCQVRHCRQT